ncbi:collagen alpha-1(XII) chain-like [Arapaima gigas]
MSWRRPAMQIDGYKIQVVSDTDEPTKELNLPASATKTFITNLTPDLDYTVTINSYYGSEESIPIFGQLTIQSGLNVTRRPQVTSSFQCSVSAVTDLVFLVDGSWSVGRENFKFIRTFISAMAGAFDIGEDKTRVGVVQYGSDTRTEFNLNQYYRRGDLLRAINTLPYKGGNTMTGDAIDYLIKNTFTEAAGARKTFPKVAMIITDGKSQDAVEEPARRLRNIGVEVFVLGIKGADEDELKQIASAPHNSHVYNVPNFDMIKEVQDQVISEVCTGVEDQLASLISGEEECSLGVDVQADVVLLVDGSYSIGLANFAKVRAFLEVLVNSFDIGPNKVQISLVQYSRDPHTEFALNTHHDRNAVVKAVRTFPYRGGSTNTGKAMTYVREKIFVTTRGARTNVPRVMILITDGKSSDAFKDPAEKLRNSDVEIFAVGVKDAVRTELEAIANPPADTHVYTVEDFDAFQRISKELTQSICLRIEQELRNIMMRNSFRVSWRRAPGAVWRYWLTYVPIQGGVETLHATTEGPETTIVLQELFPITTYRVSVAPEYQTGMGPEMVTRGTTKEARGSPRDLRVFDETVSTMRLSWQPAPGQVQQYHVAFKPSAGGERKEITVRGDTTSALLKNLQPDTEYELFVSARYSSGHGDPLMGLGTTLEVIILDPLVDINHRLQKFPTGVKLFPGNDRSQLL